MSLVHHDRVEVLSDAATYEKDGTIIELGQKVKVSPTVPMAVMPIGNSLAGTLLRDFIIMVTATQGFDGTIDFIATMFGKQKGREVPDGKHFGFIISGISETLGPCHYFIFSAPVQEFEQFDMVRWHGREFTNGAVITDSDIEALGITPDMVDGTAFTLRDYGVNIAELMRRKKLQNDLDPGAPEVYGIGGFLQLTTITADGATTETIHEWPEDEIGRPVDPFATERLAA